MPRKKSAPLTTNTLNAIVVELANENARLKNELENAQSDLTETIDRMMENMRKDKSAIDAIKKDLELLRREIDGKNAPSEDSQWYISKLRLMRSQLEKMKKEVASMEDLIESKGLTAEMGDRSV